MEVTSRPATSDDLAELLRLYRVLEKEQTLLKEMWPLADGLDEPVDQALARILADGESVLHVGAIDGAPMGFVWARSEGLLSQAGGRRVGSIRLIFTEPEARGVGVGAAMIAGVLTELRGRGLSLFDAHVLPGHRDAKNFFEAHGFAARLIVMHQGS